ncbi:MAG: hypothetical protein WA981_17485 [Glaciecola sp.]
MQNQAPPGFNGQYNFDIKDIFSRAMKLSSTNNWTLAQALLCILAITFVVYFIFIDAYGLTDLNAFLSQESPLSPEQQIFIELTLTSLTAPLWTGVTMLAIKAKRGEDTAFTDIFVYFRLFIAVTVASVLISTVFTIGLSLYIIPGFYIFVATTFTLPLIADRGLAPISAVLLSIKMTNVYLIKMLILFGIFLVMMVLVLVSFGVAYIWVGPFYFNVKAILYEDLFGSEQVSQQAEHDTTNDGVFNA